MGLHELLNSIYDDTAISLRLFLPELVLCITVLVMLIVRICSSARVSVFPLALLGSIAALGLAIRDAGDLATGQLVRQEIFTGLLAFDSFTVFFRCLLLLFAVLFCILTWLTGIPDREDGPDFFTLVLGATLGMSLMASANHLLMVFLAVEMASVPSYVLAGLLKGRKRSSEAALKYSVYGAGAAGVMLYGISLIAGIVGSVHLPTVAEQLAAMDIPGMIAAGTGGATIRVLALAGLMIMVGLAFKLSAVPFHFWCPDVFEGATAEVNAFLSVASKAAALALLVRVAMGLGYLGESQPAESVTQTAGKPEAVLVAVSDDTPSRQFLDSESRATLPAQASDALAPVRSYTANLLAFIAAITCTFGNLAAYGQRNIKRLLAYSTIAHAGYMIMPVAAAVAVVGTDRGLAQDALAALTFYIVLYLFMNLGAFAIVAFLRNATHSEQVADYAGLIRSCPVTVVCFALIFFSLIGLPPFAGFVGKFAIFVSLVEVGGPVMITLLFVAGINTAISLVYYLWVIKVMTIDPEPDSRSPVQLQFFPVAYAVAITVPVVVLGVYFVQAYAWAEAATKHLFS